MELCTLCPRNCRIDRRIERGFCQFGDEIRVAKAMLHFGEEPCISGSRGSGAVFFAGCSLRCVFCQNNAISRGAVAGRVLTVDTLSELFNKIEASGAHNINLVTPTHFLDKIALALEKAKPKIPVVYNCGGYESPEALERLNGLVNIYMPDFKYYDDSIAIRYSRAPHYAETAAAAIAQMLKQVGKPLVSDDGIMQSGVIIRHLVLPSHKNDSIAVMKLIAEKFGADGFILSLMSQYTPCGEAADFPEINRRLFGLEYDRVAEAATRLGLSGYLQERSSATLEMTPHFEHPDEKEFL